MSDVIAIRVPKKLKKELQELNPDYAQDLKKYIEEVVKRKKLKKALDDAERLRSEFSKKGKMTVSSAELIREDRDHAH